MGIRGLTEPFHPTWQNSATMNLEEHLIECPYCGEVFTALVDPSVELAEYVEDCEVCCQPIVFSVSDNGPNAPLSVSTRQENN